MKVKVTTRGEVNIVKIEGAIKSGDEYNLAEKMEKYIKMVMVKIKKDFMRHH